MLSKVSKYDVLLIKFDPSLGHEQRGLRPAIVIQSNLINNVLGITIVAPITSSLIKGPSSILIENYEELGLIKKSKILFHQIKVIDEKQVVKKIGRVENAKLKSQINEKIELVFDLNDMF